MPSSAQTKVNDEELDEALQSTMLESLQDSPSYPPILNAPVLPVVTETYITAVV